MTARRFALIAVACAGLGACAAAGPPPAPVVSAPAPADSDRGGFGQTADAEQEAIYAAGLGRAGLTVRVKSNGCTKREDFKAQVLDGYPAPTVILHRTKPDLCRAFVAGGADIVFSWAELGLKATSPIVLANPLTADPTPGR